MENNRGWRGLIIAALLISLLVILVAGASRIGGGQALRPGAGGADADLEIESTVNLPIVVGQETQTEPSPIDLLIEKQGGSIDLIIGAAMIVIIIVSGVIFGRRR